MKKITAALLSMVLILSLACQVWAADSLTPVLKLENGSGGTQLILNGLKDELVYSVQLALTANGSSGVSFTPASNSENYYSTCKTEGNQITIYIDSIQPLNDAEGTAVLGTLNLGGNTLAGNVRLTLLGRNLEPIITQQSIRTENSAPSGSGPSSSSSSSSGSSSSSSTGVSTSDKTTTVTPNATVQGSTATASVSASTGDTLVRQAKNSERVVIAPRITRNVTKTAVSLPASTAEQLGKQTNADFVISTSVANVTIPNTGLKSLSSLSGTITVTAEKTGDTAELSIIAGGKPVKNIPVVLTVPVADDGPGTVAILILEDGTQKVIQKSVAVNGLIKIPLNGPAKVRIVDNSTDFEDISPEYWAADAIAFASAHELFAGTAPGRFNAELLLNRAMVSVILHKLEDNLEPGRPSTFTDVEQDAWYTKGIAWAAGSGYVTGYPDGRFGPDDKITREQFAAILWRIAGSPEAVKKELDFTDADKASGWALEALYWAAENGIVGNKDSGVLGSSGMVSRAETAQMLKKFIETQQMAQ